MINTKPFYIAEVSSNHNCDIDRCLEFIDVAADIGCDAVKFQLFKIEELFAPEILAKSEEHRKRKEWELPLEFIPKLSKYTREKGLQFSCTPFYIKAVKELQPYVDFYKIASYELLWEQLIEECSKTNLPLILSTGMSNMKEITNAVDVATRFNCKNLSLLHCNSGYPTPINDCNLSAIKTMQDSFNCSVGWSDHSVNPVVISQAINEWGAEIIEFHLDIEGNGEEFKTGHCWLPYDIQKVINATKNITKMNGSGKKEPSNSEIIDRDWRADPIDGLRPLKSIRTK